MLARRHKMQEGKVFEERYIAYPDGVIGLRKSCETQT